MMPLVRSAAAGGSWLDTEWGSIALVFLVGLAATLVIVGLYALGIRFLAVGAPDVQVPVGEDPEGPTAVVGDRVHPRPLPATLAGLVCFAGVAAAVVYGIYLVIPLFHGS
ncbi:hypothetical protein [uncultured Microbacterium sp.]|uniref:hypothetical protein n=1 Tax=uncultured Microbacterium sp. TaxID=191216 RepID=UPI0026076F5E|nr:hypothetical protein [uncultured Microbacterium sp.]